MVVKILLVIFGLFWILGWLSIFTVGKIKNEPIRGALYALVHMIMAISLIFDFSWVTGITSFEEATGFLFSSQFALIFWIVFIVGYLVSVFVFKTTDIDEKSETEEMIQAFSNTYGSTILLMLLLSLLYWLGCIIVNGFFIPLFTNVF
jgi:hypothetical protein